MAVISNCDATTDWTGHATASVLSIDTTDKKEGTGCLVDTVASPTATINYGTKYDPTGTWDWSAKKHILFWLKCDRTDANFTTPVLIIYEGSNYRYWNLTFSANTWTSLKFLLSTGDGVSGTPPNLALIDYAEVRFKAKDTTAFYKKIDNVWVSRQPYDSSLFMTMDMKL